MKRLSVIFAVIALAASGWAEDISGTILIKRKLTKQSVTPPISIYQRGPQVKTGKDSDADPLSLERLRVVIYLEGPGPAESGPAGAAIPTMEQVDRRFLPELLVIPAGSTVSFPNRDPVFHNVFSLSKAKSFDLGSYDKGDTRKVVFPKPGIVEVYCHLHPDMEGTIMITPNRWYARSDAAGQYRIHDVPPGHYTLVAWHKSAGFFRKAIVIEAGHDAVADFFIPIESKDSK